MQQPATALSVQPAAARPATELIRIASCACGTIELQIRGPSLPAHAFCHCIECRMWHSAPFAASIPFQKGAISVQRGREFLAKMNFSPRLDRYFCGKCGTRLWNGSESAPVELTFPVLRSTPSLAAEFVPVMHLFYSERLSRTHVRDALPKFANRPLEYGGTGDRIQEE